MNPQRILVTGAAGFMGSHVVRHLLSETDAHLILPVTFRHRGNAARLHSATRDHPEWLSRTSVLVHDLRGPLSITQMHEIGEVDAILNLASESHVDRSISDPVPFVMNNVAVMLNVLEMARQLKPEVFVQVSTDEVYGPAPDDVLHAEWSPILPSNPYSASKASQEAIAVSYWRTFGVPVIITNTMNIVGEMQDREKFIPMIIKRIHSDEPVTVHVDTDGTPGSRFYLHARNQADALLFVMRNVAPPMYPDADRPMRLNIVGDVEINNIEMASFIGEVMGREPILEPVSFHSSRPGHDLRYALDGSKIAGLGWKAPVPFHDSLAKAVHWTLDHPEWLL